MKVHTHSLAFDTNIFKRIIKKGHEQCFESLFRNLNQAVNPKNEYTGFMSTVTPFLLLEYLGQVPPDISIDDFTTEHIKNVGGKLPQDVFNRALSKYESEPSVSESNLKAMNEENKKYISDKAKKLYEDVADRIANQKGFSKQIRQNLAMDFSYRYPYAQHLKGDDIIRVNINAMYDIYRAHKARLNFTQMRGVLKLCEDLRKRNTINNMSNESKQILSATEGIKGYRDLFDLDLVQLACLGAFVDGKKYPVIFLTEDGKESVASRIRLFKNTFHFFNEQTKKLGIIDQALDFFEPVEILEGRVAFVNKSSCEITEILEVKSIAVEPMEQ